MKEIKPKKIKRYSEVLPSNSSKEQTTLPKVSLSLDIIPEAEKWEIGKEYYVTLKVKMTGLNINKSEKNTSEPYSEWSNNARFDIVGIETENDKDYNEEVDKD